MKEKTELQKAGPRTIPLTRGPDVIVDADDYERLAPLRWHAKTDRSGSTYARRKPFMGTTTYMHREIMHAQSGQYVDHINGNTLDNRKANLRFCTHVENFRNSRCRRDSRAGFKGVNPVDGTKWRARITVDGKRLWAGPRRATKEEAARDYDAAALLHFGEFAHPNFPTQKPSEKKP